MKYSLYTFDSREAARNWLVLNGFLPAPEHGVLGLWANAASEQVRAFQSLLDSWTVERYNAPNPVNFICE